MNDLSHAFLNQLIHKVDNSILITDTELDKPGPRIVWANEPFLKMTGYTLEEIVDKTPRIFQGPETSRDLMDELKGLLSRDEVFFGQTINYKKDGTPFYLRWHIYPMTVPGEGKYFVAIENDVTQWIEDQNTIIESKKMIELSFEALQDLAIIRTNKQGIIEDWSGNAEKIFGFTAEEANGQDIAVLTESKFSSATELFEELHEDKFMKLELELRNKHGQTFCSEFTVAKRPDTSGKNIGYVISVVDITERKQKDNELKKNLKEKETLLDEIHHRVKNNLQVMSSLVQLQLIKLKGHDETCTTSLQQVVNQLKAMSSLHQQLYEDTSIGKINLKHYCSSLFRNLSAMDISGKVEFINNVDDIYVTVDHAMPLGLLINELITNSLKHAFEGVEQPQISVATSEREEGLHFCYTDNGMGVSEDMEKSLGTKIIGMLIKQLAATEHKKPSEGEGFHLCLTFDITDHSQ